MGIWALGQFGEANLKYSKIKYKMTHEKQPKVFISTFHNKLGFILVSRPFKGWVIIVLQLFVH